MNSENLNHITGSLSDLQDIIVPESVNFFPPAPAWYSVTGLLIFFIIRWGLRRHATYQENRYRREAEKQLNDLEKTILTTTDPDQQVRSAMALPGLLKQTAISAYKRETVARLSQDQWLAFLDKRASMTAFTGAAGQVLTRCAYGTAKQINAISTASFIDLTRLIRKWIRTHAKEQV